MKYIIVGVQHYHDSIEREWPIIFPNNLVHAIMFDAMKAYFRQEAREVGGPDWTSPEVRIVSAGDINNVVTGVGGRSKSLKIASRPDDEEFIASIEYNAGIR